MYIGYINPKTLNGNLRQRCLKTLSDGLDANPDIKPAVWSKPGKCLFIQCPSFAISRSAVSGLF